MRSVDSINKRMDELISIMISEKDIVNDNISIDWNKVKLYGHKASSTMKALRKYNEYLKKIIN